MLTYILAIVTGLLVIGADRYTKYLILLNPENYNGKTFIKGFNRKYKNKCNICIYKYLNEEEWENGTDDWKWD